METQGARSWRRTTGVGIAAIAVAVGVPACGGSGAGAGRPAATITLLMSTSPGSLDPGVANSPQALEADWLVYTPLLTYAHAGERSGTQVIPGLATALPVVSDGGRLYTLTLRPALVYSNGRRVLASDFERAVERTLRLRWQGAREEIIGRIRGAAAYARGAARSISGISADDATGLVTIRLTRPDGLFENVLAEPALAPLPPDTPFRDLSRRPPPGVGPYEIARVRSGRSFLLRLNPRWSATMIHGIPSGHVDVRVRMAGDASASVRSVLDGRADVLDPWDPLTPATVAEPAAGASTVPRIKVANETYFIFMDAQAGPFRSQLVRQAVVTAVDAVAFSRATGDGVLPGCYLLPPPIVGHPSAKCPNGDPSAGGNLAAARRLVESSGMAGRTGAVWSAAGSPLRSWVSYYASLMDQIGIRPRLTPARERAQTGVDVVTAQLPNPAAYYLALLDARELVDPEVKRTVRTLGAVPAGELTAVDDLWQDLDEYVVRNAYVAVIGYRTLPEVVSRRLDPKAVIFNPVVGYDWTSFRLR